MWSALIPAIASLLGLFKGGGSEATTSSATTDPAIQKMLETQLYRTKYQDPLFEAITKMAMGMLPTQYQGTGGQMNPIGNGQIGGPAGPGGATLGKPNPDLPRPAGMPSVTGPWSTPDELRSRQRIPPMV